MYMQIRLGFHTLKKHQISFIKENYTYQQSLLQFSSGIFIYLFIFSSGNTKDLAPFSVKEIYKLTHYA